MLIRFKKNDGTEYPQWEEKRLGAVLKERNQKNCKDGTYEHVSLTQEGVIPKTDRYNRDFLVRNEDKEYKITKLNDICYNPANLKFGVICRNKYGNGIFSPIYITFEIDNAVNPIYMEYFLTRADFINYALKYQQGTVYERMAVSPTDLLSINIKLPSIEEQQKIADFLSTVDQKIEAQKSIVADYEELKKGTMQKIFNQEIRFKDDDGNEFPEWMEKRLGDYLIYHNEKTNDKEKYELYSLTIEHGVVPKTERYEREFLITKDTESYKIVPENAFVYNPMNLRFGAIKVNHSGKKISVSGYYDVFSFNEYVSTSFLGYFLQAPLMLNYYNSIATGTLEEKKRVHYSQFKEIKKDIPCLEEQKKIADCLSALDRKIEVEKRILADLEELKKGLLQGIFNN